ncbi:MAG TPA: PQQ-dependent sugar dehydrogenase [Bryobacteraceae bacterium]|nr:PQQ-dependent sugar dehydrogenase [Bryobacteraceae bacterium]
MFNIRRTGGVATVICTLLTGHVRADSIPPQILISGLQVSTAISSGLTSPIGIVFPRADEYWVLEKNTGAIRRVLKGVLQPTPLVDLAVNAASERGLLSAVLHPNFATNGWVYVRWTESSTGADTTVVAQTTLLGNRLDRFVWNPTAATLTFDRNILRMRALQTDNVQVPGQTGGTNPGLNGNHNGGPVLFGPDGKLYLFLGDVGRRGQLQNLPNGPFLKAPFVDDTFGGPAPDDAHLTGAVLRLNDDGTTPADNPFFATGAAIGGEVGSNLRKVFSYGHRNGFGMAFDPYGGYLWLTENGDDSFSEINRAIPGMNGGWIQVMGPLSRFSQFKTIETLEFGRALQQVRYPPTRLAYAPALALARMFMLPGATYVDPDFSWKYEVAPAGTAFVRGTALTAENDGTLWVGSALPNAAVGGTGGSLYRFKLNSDRLRLDLSADPRLADRVADNTGKHQGTESETLIVGRGFGATPDIKQAPDGSLYVVSLSDNAIYRISAIQ